MATHDAYRYSSSSHSSSCHPHRVTLLSYRRIVLQSSDSPVLSISLQFSLTMAFCLDKTQRFHVHSTRVRGVVSSSDFTGDPSTSEVSITASIGRVDKRKRVVLPRQRPNFFVGVKLDGMEEKVKEVQNKILDDAKPMNVSKTFTSSKKMHLTGDSPPHVVLFIRVLTIYTETQTNAI